MSLGCDVAGINTDLTATGVVEFNVPGLDVISVQLSGTWTGTVAFEVTNMTGTPTWVACDAFNVGLGGVVQQSVTTNGLWVLSNAVGVRFRLNYTKTSGTLTYTLGSRVGELPYTKTMLGAAGAVPTDTLTRPNDTNAYVAGDELTDTDGLILQFAGCARAPGLGGMITGLQITNSVNAAVKATGELRLYDTTSTPAADNAAFNASDTVNDTLVATIPFVVWSDGLTGTGGNCVCDVNQLNMVYKCAAADTVLYGRVIFKTGYTSPANGDTWKFKLRTLLD